MSTTFRFDYKGFAIEATVSHNGDSVTLTADVKRPDLPTPEEVFALITAFLAKKGVK